MRGNGNIAPQVTTEPPLPDCAARSDSGLRPRSLEAFA